MTTRDFCYWLQGFLEIRGKDPDGMTSEQVEIVKNHLNLVFIHDIDGPDPTGKLQAAHDGKPPPGPDPFSNRPPGARC